jgi:hypothetical protein
MIAALFLLARAGLLDLLSHLPVVMSINGKNGGVVACHVSHVAPVTVTARTHRPGAYVRIVSPGSIPCTCSVSSAVRHARDRGEATQPIGGTSTTV